MKIVDGYGVAGPFVVTVTAGAAPFESSAMAFTTVAELSAGRKSTSSANTVALLVIRRIDCGVRVTAMEAVPPTAIPPRSHDRTPLTTLQLPWLAIALDSAVVGGSVSVNVTTLAGFGPKLLTV